MKSVIAALLISTLATPAFADEPACVRGFRLKNADYYTKTENLQTLQTASEIGQWVGGPTVGAACLILNKRGWLGVAGCTVLGVAISAGGGVGANMSAASIERERALAQMEDAFLTFQVYRAYKAGDAAKSADVAVLLRALGVNLEDDQDDSTVAEFAAKTVGYLMESGQLCGGGSEPTVGYWDMLDLVKSRL